MQLFQVTPSLGKGQRAITIAGPGLLASALLGRLAEVGPTREVLFDLDKQHVIAVVGKRGSGKTHTLGVLVEGLAAVATGAHNGVATGSRRHAVVIFDTLNLFQWIGKSLSDAGGPTVATQLQLLRKWGLKPAPIAANLMHPVGFEPAVSNSKPFSIRAEDMSPQDWARLLQIDLLGEPLGHLLAQIYRRAAANRRSVGCSLSDLIRVLRTDADVQSDYSAETLRALRQRLLSYEASSLFDQSVDDWTTAIRPGAVTVVLLGRAPEDVRSVLVFLIIRRLLEARAAASERAKHALLSGDADVSPDDIPPTWLVIDEAQNVAPSSNATAANDILVRYVREGRNFGLSLAISTQQPSAIDPKVMAQVDALLTHTLTVRSDLSYVMSNLKSAEPSRIALGARPIELSESIRLLEPGQCVLSAVDSTRLAFLDIRPRLTLHGGFEV